MEDQKQEDSNNESKKNNHAEEKPCLEYVGYYDTVNDIPNQGDWREEICENPF